MRTISFGIVWFDSIRITYLWERWQFLRQSLLFTEIFVLLGHFRGTAHHALQSWTRSYAQSILYTWKFVFPPETHAADQPGKGTTPLWLSWLTVTGVVQPDFLSPRHLPLDTSPFSAVSLWICKMWFGSRSKSKPLQGVWEFRFQPAPISNMIPF